MWSRVVWFALLTSCAPAVVAPAPAAPCPSPAPSGSSPAAATATVASAPSIATAPPTAAPSSGPTAKTTPAPAVPTVLRDALTGAEKALAARDFRKADEMLAVADGAAGTEPSLTTMVARVRAARWVLAGDLERAAEVLTTLLPVLVKRPDLPEEFRVHNMMMMIRTAQGDPAAALAENDQATLAAARGTWDDPEKRDRLALMKDRWHRAYLTRMLAESRTGSAKQSLVQYARSALEEYRAIGYPDSIAILDAYFAALDGRKADALAAAKKVDATKNDDLEDLYLVVVGLEAGGDKAGAEAVRAVMRRAAGPYVSHAIMLRWIDMDTRPAKTRGFTPWNAGAR
ncbi:MAG: hypothetical protein JST00_34550 [Deltaproteobacteria bacterium]|nr:hypothetical protein [Deltaproteobacteria bacterium]